MSDVALFELEVPEWVPVYAPAMDFDPFKEPDRWKVYAAGLRCRDCGMTRGKMPWTRGCGGAVSGVGGYDLCDDCAALDGVGERPNPSEADVSLWGIQTTAAERERLVELQRKRRAKYLSERES